MSLPPAIHIQHASLSYAGIPVFTDLSLELPAGKWVALLGPSGIGKTSLLRLIANLTTSDETSKGTLVATNHLPVHQQIAYMAQTDLLLPWLNVYDNAALSFHAEPDKERIINLLKKVGLAHVTHAYPHQLSGGMRQRVALVRTLLQDKPIILMDEPFSALDAITRYQLQALSSQLLTDKTVFFITHDPTEALRLAHEIYIMGGHPVTLTKAVTLASATPRELTDIDLINWQSELFKQLTTAATPLTPPPSSRAKARDPGASS